VYLIRSMGTIYGVTVTSAIVQNVLLTRLPETLGNAATEEVGAVLNFNPQDLAANSCCSSSRDCANLCLPFESFLQSWRWRFEHCIAMR
jgi:hypothetical protein